MEKQKTDFNTTYTVIIHPIRTYLGLSNNEYMLCDMVYHLSNNPKYKSCIMSKANIAKKIGISERAAYRIINRMIEIKLIEKNEIGLNTTKRWYSEVICQNGSYAAKVEEALCQNDKDTMTNCQGDTAKMAGNSNKDNNKNTSGNSAFGSIPGETFEGPLGCLGLVKNKESSSSLKDPDRLQDERSSLIGFYMNESERIHGYYPETRVDIAHKRLIELYKHSDFNELHDLIEWYLSSDSYDELGPNFITCCCMSSLNNYRDYKRKIV